MQPEFLSGEASASPAVEPLLEAARVLEASRIATGALSARNGSRTTTHAGTSLGALAAMDFVEVADFDPHLERLLCLGRREPHAHAGMHHLMLRAKTEIHAIVMIEARAPASVPRAEMAKRPLENAMRALEKLRGSDAVALGAHLVVVGPTVASAARRALELAGAAE